MECNKDENLKSCNCTYEPCPRKDLIRECSQYHFNMRQLPGCCFHKDVEKTFDRSFERFANLVLDNRT
jgi:hypothetical protein